MVEVGERRVRLLLYPVNNDRFSTVRAHFYAERSFRVVESELPGTVLYLLGVVCVRLSVAAVEFVVWVFQ